MFLTISTQVESMLRESVVRFLTVTCANSGQYRRLCGMFVGVTSILVGLIPILLSILDHRSRWLRIAALPGIWFGLSFLIAAFHNVIISYHLHSEMSSTIRPVDVSLDLPVW
jgi:hypothetical protein